MLSLVNYVVTERSFGHLFRKLEEIGCIHGSYCMPTIHVNGSNGGHIGLELLPMERIGNLISEAYFEVFYLLVEDSFRTLEIYYWLLLLTNCCLSAIDLVGDKRENTCLGDISVFDSRRQFSFYVMLFHN